MKPFVGCSSSRPYLGRDAGDNGGSARRSPIPTRRVAEAYLPSARPRESNAKQPHREWGCKPMSRFDLASRSCG